MSPLRPALMATLLLAAAACSDPTGTRTRSPGLRADDQQQDHGDGQSFRHKLSAVHGEGGGRVTLIPGISPTGGFTVDLTVKIHDVTPNTTFFFQRAADAGRSLAADGICQRALGLYPWEQPNSPGFPPAPAFITVPRPFAGPLFTVTTGDDGSGSAHYFFTPPVPGVPGATFDIMIRLVDNESAPTTELRTECFQVNVRNSTNENPDL